MARCNVICEDLSDGLETFLLRVVNDADNAVLDKDEFVYVPWLEKMEGDTARHSCECEGGACTSACSCNSNVYVDGRATVGRLEGIVTECGPSCSCSIFCPYRLTQKGQEYPIEIFRTMNRGWGVRALKQIPRGSYIGEYTGALIREYTKTVESAETMDEDSAQHGERAEKAEEGGSVDSEEDEDTRTMEVPIEEYRFETVANGDTMLIDASAHGNFTRYINHSCGSVNTFATRVFRSGDSLTHICLFTLQKISVGQELTINYGDQWWNSMNYRFACACGSSVCRYPTKKVIVT